MAHQGSSAVSISVNLLDHFEGRPVQTYTLLDHKTGIQVVLLEWGAGVQSLKWPDSHGNAVDVVLGNINTYSYGFSHIGC